MKTYNAVFNEGEQEGVFGISLVENPAMEGEFIALSKEKIQFKEVDGEKRILIGLVLEPNKPIYRNQGGREFNIVFTDDTIRDLSYNFFKANHHKNSTIEHENPIEGVTVVESWIVDNPEQDKSTYYGLSNVKGSWVIAMKIDSDEIWNGYVKEGKVQGFSIDAMIKLEEVKPNIQMKEDEKSFLTELKEVLGLSKKVEIKLGSVKTADGEVTLMYDGEVLENGTAVFTETEDGERVPAPAGEHKLEGGNTIVVAEDGLVSEVKPTAAEEAPQELEEEGPAASAPVAEVENEMEDLMNAIKKITVQYSEDTKKENETVLALSAQVKELKEELLKLKEEPAATAKKSQPTQPEANTKQSLTEFLNNKL